MFTADQGYECRGDVNTRYTVIPTFSLPDVQHSHGGIPFFGIDQVVKIGGTPYRSLDDE